MGNFLVGTMAKTDIRTNRFFIHFMLPASLNQGCRMKKQNIIDLEAWRKKQAPQLPATSMSEELKNAIQALIHRLRYLGPCKQSGNG